MAIVLSAAAAIPLAGEPHVTEILGPRLLLYMGNAAFASSRSLLARARVTHIVTAAATDGFGELFPGAFSYHVVPIEDSRDAPFGALAPGSSAFIAAALAANPDARVLVHCKMGTSRSAALVLHYLMSATDKTLRAGLLHIMAARAGDPKAPYTHPNFGFWDALVAAESVLQPHHPPSLLRDEYNNKFCTGKNLPGDPA